MGNESSPSRLTKTSLALLIVILSVGVFLRAWPSASFKGIGNDEHNYATYVEKGVKYGLSNYGRVIDEFIASQVQQAQSLIPATRIGFIWPAILLASFGKLDPLYALRLMSHGSAILLLIATAILAYRFGGVCQMLLVTFIAGALAVIILASLLGGLGEWITFCRMYAKGFAGRYAVQFQGGAWYRYLVDFTLLSPCIVALMFGRIFNIDKESRFDFFWALLLGFSFLAMSTPSYGMSLRYAAYWDLPLRWLAASQLLQLPGKFPRIKPLFALAGLVLILAAVDLFQYWRYFVHAGIYDPVTFKLIYASKLFQ